MKRRLIFSLVLLGLCQTFVDGARLYFEPDFGELIKDCPNEVDIMIDPEGEEIFGASVDITFDYDNIDVIAFYPNDRFNLPLQHHNIEGFRGALFYEAVDPDSLDRKGLKKKVRYGTLVVRNVEDVSNLDLSFVVTSPGDTSDNTSVFALSDGRDVLSSYKGATFDLVAGACEKDYVDNHHNLLGKDPNHMLQENIDTLNASRDITETNKFVLFVRSYWYYGIMLILVIVIGLLFAPDRDIQHLVSKLSRKK